MNIKEIVARLKAAEQGNNGMFQIGEDEICALVAILEPISNRQPVSWWTGPEPTPTGEIESTHDHETGSHQIPLYPIEFKYVSFCADPYVCPSCGGIGWSGNCDKCIPY